MRKILVSLLVVSMLLGLVGTAYAGGFTDTTNSYVNKAAAYGWVGGYTDGTFKPEGNITRAEAAKMIVSAMGLTAAADAAKGLAPKFSDVPATHWASGYINVCVAQSVLKGYADGTFKPEANITGAEIVTMIVRGLKRESEAIGDWPVGHVTVAAANNIIGTGFTANALATRAQVAEWLVKGAAVNTLKLETTGWVDSGKTWITGKFSTKTGTVSEVDATGLTIVAGGVEYDLAADYIVGGGKTLAGMVGYVCNLTYDEVDEVVSYVAIKTDVVVKTGEVAVVGDTYFYLKNDATKYTVTLIDAVAPAADYLDLVIYQNGGMTFNKDAATIGTKFAAKDTISFYASSTNVVTYVELTKFDKENVVLAAVNKTTAPYSVTVVATKYYVPSTAKITLNGAAAAITDIKTGMYANIALDPVTSEVLTLEVGNHVVEGKATAIRTSQTAAATFEYYATIGGVEYELPTENDQTEAYAGTVTLTIDLEGTVVDCVPIQGTTPYVQIVSFDSDTNADYKNWTVKVNGVSTVYRLTKLVHDARVAAGILPGDYVELTMAGGLITGATELPLTGTPTAIDSIYTSADDSKITIAAVEYTTSDDTVVLVDGAAKTVADLVAGKKVTYVLDGTTLAFIMRDTVVAYDSSKVISPVANVITGQVGAIEKGSKITFYRDILRVTAENATILVGGGTQTAANVVTVNDDKSFGVTMAGTGKTIYVTIEDASGNKVDAAWTVTR